MAWKMHEPIGNGLYAPLFARVPLGLYFVVAGWEKLQEPSLFLTAVRTMNILPEPLATLYGILLPYLEITAGFFVLLGIWTTLGAIVMSVMLLSFIFAFGVFEKAGANGISYLFNKDIILLGFSVSLLYSGAGSFSVDRFRKMG